MKRKALIDTARDLFFKYGIKRVTVEEICRESGVSKMTFYKHYANKNELVKAIISDLTEEGLNEYREIMARKVSFDEKVKEIIRMKQEGTQALSREFLSDYIPHATPEMQDFLHAQARATWQEIVRDFAAAQQRGELREDVRLEFVLWFLEKMFDLMKDETLEKMYNEPQEMIMELVNFFFYGIMPHK